SFKALSGFAKHKDPKVRRSVIQAIGRLRQAASVPLLRSMLERDPSYHIQAEAARALGSLGNPQVLSLLRRKLAQRSYWDIVKGGVLSGIANLKDKKTAHIFRQAALPSNSYPARVYALRALADFAPVSSEVVPWLCEFLEDPDDRIALPAAGTLG